MRKPPKSRSVPAYPTLRRLRERAGLSQAELSRRIGMNYMQYNQLERGNGGRRIAMGIDIAWRIARGLGRRIDEVFPYDEVVSVDAPTSEPAEERTMLDIYTSE